MTKRLARYAPHLALAGAVLLLVGLATWLVAGEIGLWSEITGALGILLLAALALLRPDAVRSALGARQTRYGGNTVVMSVVFALILGLVNYLGARHSHRWDVTEEKQFTLSEQTLRILDSLDRPVEVKLFFTPAHYNRMQAEDLIKEYAARSPWITYDVIDPETQRRVALDYQVARDGTIIMECGDRREVTFGAQEQDLTGTLLKVISDTVHGVYLVTGHGERNPESYEERGYSTVRSVLESENYKVDTLTLATGEAFPEDLSVLVIADPQTPFEQGEVDRLRAFLDGGGKLLLLAEPGGPDPLDGLTETYGVTVRDELVIDPVQSFFGDPATPLVSEYRFHQITKDLGGLASIFPTARPLALTEPAPEGWSVYVLASSSSASWAERDYRGQQVSRDEGETEGPLPLAVAIERDGAADESEAARARLVIIGDADLVSNQVLNMVRGVANVDLFMNAVGWLAQEEVLISIRPKEIASREVYLTPGQARGIIYGNILFVPVAVLLAGVVVWWRRR